MIAVILVFKVSRVILVLSVILVIAVILVLPAIAVRVTFKVSSMPVSPVILVFMVLSVIQ